MTSDHLPDELLAVEQALAAFEKAPTGEYFGAQLMQTGLERRRGQILARRLEDVPQSAEALDLMLLPSAHSERGVDVSVVATVLTALQETIQALAQSLKERPTSRGVVPVEIQEAVRLRVSFALPGSLDLRLVPAAPTRQQPLFADGEETLLQLSVDAFLSVLDAAVAGDQANLLHQIATFGPRATTHLESLTGMLSKSDSAAVFRWRSHRTVRSSQVTSSQSAAFNTVLKQVQLSTREQVLTGRIVGGSLARRVFELELPDGSLLTGKAEEDVLDTLEERFGQDCTATIQVSETRLPSGETREAFLLKTLRA